MKTRIYLENNIYITCVDDNTLKKLELNKDNEEYELLIGEDFIKIKNVIMFGDIKNNKTAIFPYLHSFYHTKAGERYLAYRDYSMTFEKQLEILHLINKAEDKITCSNILFNILSDVEKCVVWKI